MTNKPMLSVKKFIHEVTYEGGEMVEVDKLPELCGSELYVLDSDYQSLHEQLELLRAFLDKPVLESQYDGMTQAQAQAVSDGVEEILHGKPAAEPQGEPVAYLLLGETFYGTSEPEIGDFDIQYNHEACDRLAEAFPGKQIALYAEQPAPVADHTQCEECKGWGYHENHHEGGGTECGECGGSGNASVAVVMPERMYSDSLPSWAEEQKLVRGWNACLEEVARLNGVKP